MIKNKRNLILSMTVMFVLLHASNFFILNANAQTNNNTINYTIKKGDTFYLLGLRFNSSVKDISFSNPKVDPYNLMIGSKIKLPIGSGIMVHHVKKGDTLWRIAGKYNTTVNMIAEKNYIKNPNLIYTGDILAINETMKELLQIAGSWRSTGTTQYHSTHVSIAPTGYNTFNIGIDAFQINAFGAYQERSIAGRGEIKNNKIEFVIYWPEIASADLQGEITIKNNILQINYIGDITRYQGTYVGFENEFAREQS